MTLQLRNSILIAVEEVGADEARQGDDGEDAHCGGARHQAASCRTHHPDQDLPPRARHRLATRRHRRRGAQHHGQQGHTGPRVVSELEAVRETGEGVWQGSHHGQ